MPNIKSSKKQVRTDKIKTASNTVYTSKVKNSIKKLEKAIKEKDQVKAKELLAVVIKNIDTCLSKGLIKRNTADRQKIRLNKKVKEM